MKSSWPSMVLIFPVSAAPIVELLKDVSASNQVRRRSA